MKKSVNTSKIPLYREAGFSLKNAETTAKAFEDEKSQPHEPENYIYSRYRNPTVVAAEQDIMRIEEANWALLAETGMAAIDIAVSIFQKGKKTRPWIFFHEIYGGTNSFIDSVLIERRGIDVHRFYGEEGQYDLGKLENMLRDLEPEFLYFEAVSNPMLIVADVEKILGLAKKYGVKTIVDNTFGTPVLWKPLQDEVSLVIHSVTKYLSGHGDITAGVVCGNDQQLYQHAIEYRKWAGHFLSPDDAHRLIDQLKTFELRFQRHCDNAMSLAKFLQSHQMIEHVMYPGLPEHPTHPEAKKLFGNKGYGGMITFDIVGADAQIKAKNRDRLIESLSDSIHLIPTLGEVDSILMPIEPVWGAKYPEPGMVRLSVGIENPEYLKRIIGDALDLL